MNITGDFSSSSPWDGIGGAFSKSYQELNNSIGSNAAYWSYIITLNAANSWTGETSAVGGGESHTHGIKMTDGKYLKTGGGTGGSNTSTVSVKGEVQGHTLTINEIPSHTHTRGSMNITGSFDARVQSTDRVFIVRAVDGAFTSTTLATSYTTLSVGDTNAYGYTNTSFNASRSWTGETCITK